MENSEYPGLPENEKQKWTQQYRDINIPVGLEEKTLAELKRRGYFYNPFFSHFYLKAAIIALFVVFIFVSGYLAGQHTGKLVSRKNEYLLLLYNPRNFIESPTHAKEYGAWLHQLQSKGQMMVGEELQNKGWSLTTHNTDVVSTYHMASGFFILHAESENEALQIATTCPHLKYNGRIEVRPIIHK